MPVIVLGILASVFLLGVVVVCLAWRGRRINAHPVCGWCRFDLDGVYPGATTCPECGGGLLKAGKVRTGVRKRMPIVGLVGVAMVLLPVGVMGMVLYATLTSTDLNKYKPVALLRMEVRHARGTHQERAADELLRRAQANTIKGDELESLARMVLEIQQDRAMPWSEKFGDLVVEAHRTGAITDDVMDDFLLNAGEFKFETRKRARAGDPLPVSMEVVDTRVATRTQESGSMNMLLVSVDGATPSGAWHAPVDASFMSGLQTMMMGPTGSQGWLGGFELLGSTARNSGWGGWPQDNMGVLQLPTDLAPGTRRIGIEFSSNVWGQHRQIAMGSSRWSFPEPRERKFTREFTIEVLPRDATDLAAITPTPEAEAKVRAAVNVWDASITQSRERVNDGPWVVKPGIQVQIATQQCDVPFAFDVFARMDGKLFRIGSIASEPVAQDPYGDVHVSGRVYGYSVMNGNMAMSFGSELEAEPPDTLTKIDVVLRPSESDARYTLGMTSYYDGEIVLADVPLQREDPSLGMNSMSIQTTGTLGALTNLFRGAKARADAQAEDGDDGEAEEDPAEETVEAEGEAETPPADGEAQSPAQPPED
ncbi:MAG: hypothetical protein RBS39_05865 [Phycisphaerales bacterium]|jgi:hypothetical protein|nr:hypothetical protein [Phycisphaerales bacterium]